MRRREVRAGGHARWQGIWWARKWQGRAASCEVAESEGAGGCGEQGIGARLADGIPRQRAEGGHAKKCVWGAEALRCTGRRAREWGIFEIYKMNYVVKTTEFAEKPRGGRGNGVFSGIAK